MVDQTAFLLAVSMMLAHELDAVKRNEWRILPIVNRFTDEAGFSLFVVIHIPLVFGILQLVPAQQGELIDIYRLVFSGFCVVHVLLHRLYKNHPANEFSNPLSQFLIWGAGVAGAVYILVSLI